ncbi:unnamed protein product [Ilex paraguariensis]|uniref:PRA1 family protein n=1 Tax=Ilex paraguariensis TaxID=185542 RepID=A0ABC8TJ97_9AQUA
MASYGTIHRPSTTTSEPASAPQTDNSKAKTRTDFKIICPFNIPLTPEAAAVRIIRNLGYFGLYYALFIWVILFITLVPKRKLSLILLVAMTIVACLYLLLLRALPDSVVLHRIIDKRFVLFLLVVITAVELILTRAAIHLFVTLAATIPIVLVHAIFRVREDLFVNEEASAAGELVPLVYNGVSEKDKSSDLV